MTGKRQFLILEEQVQDNAGKKQTQPTICRNYTQTVSHLQLPRPGDWHGAKRDDTHFAMCPRAPRLCGTKKRKETKLERNERRDGGAVSP
jgi:hypothetical protein